MPALKTTGGEWILDSREKPTIFSTTFSDKYTLIPQETNEYSEIVASEEQLTFGPLPSVEHIAKTLGALQADGATGCGPKECLRSLYKFSTHVYRIGIPRLWSEGGKAIPCDCAT